MVLLRRLLDDFREFPATMVLGALWVLVFGLMVANQAVRGGGVVPLQLLLGPFDGHRFGDLTIRELYEGEVWRTLTATFVHYGLLHIGLNLWALYQVGSLVESWYGSGPFVAIYVLTGGGGNLISGAVRQGLRHHPFVHSGGGSTVIMGLVGLCAVVGWRSRTRVGEHLRRQMVWVLVVTAAMGIGCSAAGLPVIDNWGHAGGAFVGGLIGLANRGLVRHSGRVWARLAGGLGTVLLATSAAAMVADDRAEDVVRRQAVEQARRRLVADELIIFRLEKVRETYRTATAPRVIVRGALVARRGPSRPAPAPSVKPAADATSSPSNHGPTAARANPDQEFYEAVMNAAFKYLESMSGELDTGENSADYRRARQLFIRTSVEPPTLDEVREFDDLLSSIASRVRRDRNAAVRGLSSTRAGG